VLFAIESYFTGIVTSLGSHGILWDFGTGTTGLEMGVCLAPEGWRVQDGCTAGNGKKWQERGPVGAVAH